MSFEVALRATEVLLAVALIQSSAEHLLGPRREKVLFAARILCCALLLADLQTTTALLALCALSLVILHRFQGPYNGGSDRMGVLILWMLTAAHLAPSPFWAELALAYLAAQVTLSYFISGRVKLVKPDWRNGRALNDVFAFSAYPVTEGFRALARQDQLLRAASWAVIGFELAFPLALLFQTTLVIALVFAAGFHLVNALLFGLNRFLWIWVASYPSLLWLQERLI